MKNQLGFIEHAMHFSVWISVAFYWLYSIYKAQDVFPSKYLSPGWSILRRPMDDNDFDWRSWKYYISTTYPYSLIHLITSEIIRKLNIPFLKYWYIIFGATFIINFLNMKCLVIFLAQPMVFLAVMFLFGKKSSIWYTTIIILIVNNVIRCQYWHFWYYFVNNDSSAVYFLGFTICWIQIRCLSFSLDYVEKIHDKNELSKFNILINMFSYVLYQPLFIFGPIINCEVFERSFLEPKESFSTRIKRFVWDIILFVIYSVLMEVLLHYLYSNAMFQRNDENIKNLSFWQLWAGGFWMSCHFHAKYVLTYGTTSALSRLDNIDAPPTPRCIARIHLYSQMWKHFDVGFYRFLVRYIYIPTHKFLNTHTILPAVCNKMLSSFTTFFFVFIWHGTYREMFAWTSLNYLSIIIENTGREIGKSKSYLWFKKKVLSNSNSMEVRFKAFICTPLFIFNAIANFYLFAGLKVGNIYFSSFFKVSLSDFVLFYFVLYCYCHVSMALYDCSSRTDVSKVKSN